MNYNDVLDLKDIVYFCVFDLVWKTESWKDVKGFEGKYQVSCLGRVKSLWSKRRKFPVILKVQDGPKKYKCVRLYLDKNAYTRNVHQLVAESFLNHSRCKYEMVVDHIDNDNANNYYLNLQLISARKNVSKDRKSDHVGVMWDKEKNNWRAAIHIKVPIFLGRYKDLEKAKLIYGLALINLDKFNGCRNQFRTHIKSL